MVMASNFPALNFFTASGRVRVGVIKVWKFNNFISQSPLTPALSREREREFPDGN
jgi:hypothetical protein